MFKKPPHTLPQRSCDMPGCQKSAEYRAPKSRHQLREYYWFCFNHIREYNKNWDYFKGMDPSQIEAQLRSDVVWDKPSWKLGQLGKKQRADPQFFKDRLHILSRNTMGWQDKPNPIAPVPPQLQQALHLLDLAWPVSLQDLKKRYMGLARQYHPDLNEGNTRLEEKFKQINAAYTQLRTYLLNKVEAE